MGLELREALRRLCVDIGWSYAVFWRMIGSPTPKHLVWEDGHWCGKSQLSRPDEVRSYMNLSAELGAQGDGNIDELVRKTMVPQVHLIGDGIVGHAASIGYHQWIVREANCDSESILLHLAELKNQFVLGIQTIVILPLIPYGVLQFGSTMRVMENNLFINHVRASFMQLLCEPVSFGVIQESLGWSNLQYASNCSAASSNQNSNDCSSIDKSLSMICNHQLSISSASRSLNHISAPLSTRCQENQLKLNAQRLSTMKIVGSSLLSTEPSNPMIYPSGNSLFHLNNRLQSGLVEAQVISNRDTMLASSRATHTTDCLYFLEENLSSACGRTQESGVSIKASLEGMVGGLDTCSLHPKTEYLDYERVYSSQAGSKENFESSFCDALVFNSLNVSQDNNVSDRNLGISRNSLVNTSSINKCNGNSGPRNLKQKPDFPVSFGLTSRSCYRNVQETKLDSCSFEKLQNRRIEIDSSILHLPDENSSPFIPLASSGNDLFDVLGFYDSLDKGSSIDQNLSVDDTSCNTQSNLLPIFYSLNDNWPEIYSESNTNDQLLDAVVSKINPGARPNMNENISCTTSATKVSGSPKYCSTSSNDGSASSGKKLGEYVSPSILTSNSEVATSTSIRSADSMHKTDRSGCYKSQISLWVESGQNTKSDSHIKRADEATKVNRKRSRPGDSPRPRPKDRQLIMDRVKELREIVPNGAKCSIDALLEKTIKHMLFLQSVAKHADKLKDSGEPKIICKDGGVLLKDNFQGGATWAFEVGSQPITCPIIVEDLNPPREMLVEMLCEERGVFLEIADLIRGLGLTILKGVMEARKSKIWARFVVEANRDVTRMEIFLSLVRSLEPTFGCSSAAQYPAHNSSLPHKIFNPSCRFPVAGASDPLH